MTVSNDWNVIRRNLFPAFFKFADKLSGHVVDFYSADSNNPWSQDQRPEANLSESNTVSSRIKPGRSARAKLQQISMGLDEEPEFHKPVLDLDMPCLLLDSSTPGHHHLMIDKEIPWDKYQKLLEVMGECGLLEDGYVHASIARRGSYIRTPWSKKAWA